jgi:hypothetical protein
MRFVWRSRVVLLLMDGIWRIQVKELQQLVVLLDFRSTVVCAIPQTLTPLAEAKRYCPKDTVVVVLEDGHILSVQILPEEIIMINNMDHSTILHQDLL